MKYIHTTPEKWQHLKGYCRENRKHQTQAEKIIWAMARKSGLGVRIRRQHAIADFIVDFVCIEKKLVIEIDGETHQEQQEYDAWRTNILSELEFQVVRFTNEEVCGNPNQIREKIVGLLN